MKVKADRVFLVVMVLATVMYLTVMTIKCTQTQEVVEAATVDLTVESMVIESPVVEVLVVEHTVNVPVETPIAGIALIVDSLSDYPLLIYKYKITSEERKTLAILSVAECEGESFEGKVAAIQTVFNRMAYPWRYGSTIEEIVSKDGAYSAYGTSLWKRTPTEEDYAAVDAVLSGVEVIPSNYCIYYNPDLCDGTTGAIYDQQYKIGHHLFGYDTIDIQQTKAIGEYTLCQLSYIEEGE